MADDENDLEAEIARDLAEQVEAHREHPALVRWFRRVGLFESPMPGAGFISFIMAEFRDGGLGALVWSDNPGTWGTGGWKRLSRKGEFREDIVRMPPIAHGCTFAEILDILAALPRE